MAGFNYEQLLTDPMFAAGAGLFGAGSPIATAYGLMQQQRVNKQQQEQQNVENAANAAMMDWRNRQLAAQSENWKSEADYRKAEAQASLALVPQREAMTDLERQKVELQKRSQDMMEKLFPSLVNGGGIQMPGMPNAAPSQPGATPSAMSGPTGKYGTPTSILDNLMKVESNGNPFAMGPDIGGGVRAKGPYQFLDSTRADMEAQGYGKFDPFSPTQSRDAADWYLQKLNKQNGGDWQKTLAAYGGFKSKDASGYVNKVLTGSPESVVRQVQQNQSNPSMQMPSVAPTMQPTFKMGPNGLTLDLTPSYEGAKTALEAYRTARQVGPGGFEEQAAARANDKNQREAELHPGALAGQAATIAHTQAQTTEAGVRTVKEQEGVDKAVIDKVGGYNQFDQIAQELRGKYQTLDKMGEIINPDRDAFSNMIAARKSSAAGQLIGRNLGTQAQSIRDQIQAAKPLLLQAIRMATGMGVRQMDSDKELSFYMNAATDPSRDIKANLAALDRLESLYGTKSPAAQAFLKTEPAQKFQQQQQSAPTQDNGVMSYEDWKKSRGK